MKKLIVIAGPTACGKSSLAMNLAKKLDTKIISADSMQVYKYMDIGTAKVSNDDKKIHYMIDEITPDTNFSVADYQQLAKTYLEKIYAQKKIPILCGGTGFYINALLYENNFDNAPPNYELRNKLENLSEDELIKELSHVDKNSAEKIDKNNKKRIIRALEFFYSTGQKISTHNELQKQNKICYDVRFFVLTLPRDTLYKKINDRVDEMIKNGLVNEVEKLLKLGYDKKLNSMQSIGYKEIIMYLEKKINLQQAIDLIKINTRHYAKRQITWFKHQANGIWLDLSNFKSQNDLLNYTLTLL